MSVTSGLPARRGTPATGDHEGALAHLAAGPTLLPMVGKTRRANRAGEKRRKMPPVAPSLMNLRDNLQVSG